MWGNILFIQGEIMLKDGLGSNNEFSSFHPIVNAIYFVCVITTTMFSTSPFFLVASLIFSWCYSIILKGKSIIKFNSIITVSTLLVMTLINTLFTHNGETVLFYINTNRITMEAFIFGIASAVMLVTVIVWFTSFNVIISSDKLIYLFGKTAPVLGLTLSMIFRFIPLLKSRFKEISMGQKAMGRTNIKGFFPRVRQLAKEISILIAWSLEASIESADSMEARGYGLKGRTSFHLYKITERDISLLAIITILMIVIIIAIYQRKTSMIFYPSIDLGEIDIFTWVSLTAYIILMTLPIVIDIRGEIKWKQLT